ncbi:carboxylesterase [Variovorax sp. YR216]|nr:carboxylesterase [Variovorax sp. YR216]
MVLLHGLCSTPDELLSIAVGLRGAGYSVHALTVDGYSFEPSAPSRHATSWRQWVDAVESCVDGLRAKHDRVMLIGISAGSALALAAAMRCGARIDALVLMSTTLRFDGWAIPRRHKLLPLALYTPLGRFWRYRERAPYGVKNERVRHWIERELRQRKVSRAGAAVIGISHLREHDRLIRHVRGRLNQVTCPRVLAIHAKEDEVASVANLDLLRQGLRGCALQTVVVDNSYHMITIDNDRQQVLRETLEFAAAVSHRVA